MTRKRYQRGSLFQRGQRNKVWVARWWEDQPTAQGSVKRVRKSERLGLVRDLPKRRDAELLLAERLRSINAGSHSPHSFRRFEEFVRMDWKPVAFPTMKKPTQTAYEYQLDIHLLPALGNLALREITRERIQELLNTEIARGYALETVKHTRSTLSAILRAAEEWGYIVANPVRATHLPRQRRVHGATRIVSPAEFRQLLKVTPEPSRSLVILLAVLGLRIGEALALRWRNVRFDRNTLVIAERVYDGEFDDPKTRGAIREVEMPPAIVGLMRRRRAAKSVSSPDELVFSTPTGRPLCRRNLLRRQLKPACKKIGLAGVSWHTFRHSNVSAHGTLQTPLGTVQELVGHSSIEVTRRIYLHSYPEQRRRAARQVERFFFGPKRTQVSGKNRRRAA